MVVGATIATLLGAGQSMVPSPEAPGVSDYLSWDSAAEFATGSLSPTAVIQTTGRSAVTLVPGSRDGVWTSPGRALEHLADHLNPSWQAETPAGSRIEVRLSVREHHQWSPWYELGLWSLTDSPTFRRTSVDNQGDSFGRVFTDTFVAAEGKLVEAYRVRVILRTEGDRPPLLHQIGVQASDQKPFGRVSETTLDGRQLDLPVPGFSQYEHSGEYPAFGGGGDSWCSPTATAMVMAHWRAGPPEAELAALPRDPVFDANGREDPLVDHAAIHTFDVAYAGTGNWPFNTAYAAAYGLDAGVRVYPSLRPLEGWIRRQVPIVVSIAWDNTDDRADNDLPGASVASTPGHLMVVRGFTATGDVIANDPATPVAQGGNAAVRHVYPREPFERQWINASGGTSYIIDQR
jgi:hypothetical protein